MEELRAAVDEFFKALNMMFEGDPEPMKALWSQKGDVIFLAPDGETHKGWEEVSRNWDMQAAMKVSGHVEPSDIDYLIGQELAVVYHTIKGHHVIDGKEVPVDIRASEVFRKEDDEWKVAAVQADVLPFLAGD